MNFYSTTEWNTPWKFKITPENLPKGKARLPTIIFFGVNSLLNFNRCGQNDSNIIFSSWSNRGKVPWDYHHDNPMTSEWPYSVGFAFFKVMKLWRSWPKSPILRLQPWKKWEKHGGGELWRETNYHKIFVNCMIWIFLLFHLGPITFIIVFLEGERKKGDWGASTVKTQAVKYHFWWIVQEALCKSMKNPAWNMSQLERGFEKHQSQDWIGFKNI